mgnify:CR=1 FL=1
MPIINRFILFCLVLFPFIACNSKLNYWQKSGIVFGTSYTIVIEAPQKKDLSTIEKEIFNIFNKIDQTFSLYRDDSKIVQLNKNQLVLFDQEEIKVFLLSQEICLKTKAYFFPFKRKLLEQMPLPNEENYHKICNLFTVETFRDHYIIKKSYPFVEFDFNAIAKGYAVDLIKKLLIDNAYPSFLIEIGGEICVGDPPKKSPKGWRILLESSSSDPLQKQFSQELYLHNICLATSGNYYQLHIFNPYYNKIIQKNRVVTVLGPSCAIADAYATYIYLTDNFELYSQEYKVLIHP